MEIICGSKPTCSIKQTLNHVNQRIIFQGIRQTDSANTGRLQMCIKNHQKRQVRTLVLCEIESEIDQTYVTCVSLSTLLTYYKHKKMWQ